MLYSGTDPDSYITEYTLVYEDHLYADRAGTLDSRPGFMCGGGGGEGIMWSDTPPKYKLTEPNRSKCLCLTRVDRLFSA